MTTTEYERVHFGGDDGDFLLEDETCITFSEHGGLVRMEINAPDYDTIPVVMNREAREIFIRFFMAAEHQAEAHVP